MIKTEHTAIPRGIGTEHFIIKVNDMYMSTLGSLQQAQGRTNSVTLSHGKLQKMSLLGSH
jgi:hypothetical protein